ncbi:dihydropteridine reductase isoform X2 [Folsomia candida]|uniref:dihydropteridine reductase isoform X2 n=1 Tax=Folsomia candida TaxID=158441 RepID=UPI000B8FFC73|nr:dihydropteridine reductase isoform X2 [Folsomia candida]
MASKAVLIYGGKGALGSTLVKFFKEKGFATTSIDFFENDTADDNILLKSDLGFEDQANAVKQALEGKSGLKVDAIVCVAGGWAGGSLKSKDFIKNANLMMQQSVWSSYIAASLAPHFLRENGLLVLTGAQPALSSTPGMIGYGVAKAAVHHLTKSAGAEKGGLPEGAKSLAILPVTLDTPMNRKFMTPDGSWTPLDDVASILYNWTSSPESSPPSGSLVQLITKDGKTETKIE